MALVYSFLLEGTGFYGAGVLESLKLVVIPCLYFLQSKKHAMTLGS